MKKLIVSIFMIVMLLGCTGVNVSTTANMVTDMAFVAAIQSHPEYKPAVIIALTETKAVLQGSLTYDDLLLAISDKFGSNYSIYGVILVGYLAEDKPLFETSLPMLDSYKAGVIKKIDRFLLLAGKA